MSRLSDYISNNKETTYSIASQNTPVDVARRPITEKMMNG